MNTDDNKSLFQFSTPRLIDSVFLMSSKYPSNKLNQIKSLSFNIEKSREQIVDSEDKRYQNTTVFLSVFTSKNIELDEKTPCYIRVTMKADFRWNKEKVDKSTCETFLNINAPALLLSYIRPKISDLTKDSEIPTQEIPFIDFSNQ